jgi:hypothetical protein
MTWQDATVASVVIISIGAVLAVIVMSVMRVGRAGIEAEEKAAYQKLAGEVSATQQRISAALAETAENLGEIRARMGAIEKLMREVE